MRAVRAQVTGRVQGVGYRWSCVQQAERLGLAGWVRNCTDGSVELVAEGDDEAVDALLAWCAHGPASARVDRVATSGRAVEGHQGFTVR